MSPTRRRWIAGTLGVLALALYVADLLGLKPPPRILPSVVLGIAAVVIGVSARPEEDGAGASPHPVSRAGRLMTVAGFTLLALLLIPIVPIGLVAPAEGMLAVHGTWLAGFLAACRLRRSHPPVVLAIPFVAAAVITAILWTGTTYLGWQP